MKKVWIYGIGATVLLIAATVYRFNSSETAIFSNNATVASCQMTAQQFVVADKTDAIIIDVRTQREFDYGHLKDAVLIDIYRRDFKEKINQLDKNKRYYVYCKTGLRSRSAVRYMSQIGFTNVCDVQGGTNYLSRAGAEFVK
jgi:rhodanese-related sulfurtransferase